MIKPKNDDKTGKVTIERNSRHNMAAAVWGTFAKHLLGWGAAAFGICLLGSQMDMNEETMCLCACIGLFFGLLYGCIAAFGNMGTMVESVCFDYDNRQVVIASTSLLNKKHNTTIPFSSFYFRHKEYHTKLYIEDRIRIYSGDDKLAVVAKKRFGWSQRRYQWLEDELSGFFLSNN